MIQSHQSQSQLLDTLVRSHLTKILTHQNSGKYTFKTKFGGKMTERTGSPSLTTKYSRNSNSQTRPILIGRNTTEISKEYSRIKI